MKIKKSLRLKPKKMQKQELYIVKIGGNVIDNLEKLEAFLKDFSELQKPKILVHGGGKLATKLAEKLEIPQEFFEGRRITNQETRDVAVMVYAGLINKNIVATLQKNKLNAIGFSGADANVIPAHKRPVKTVDFGWVGDVETEKINAEFITKVIAENVCPVFCAITHDGKGNLLNTNADTIASSLAVALSSYFDINLVYCFEKNGVLENIEDVNSVISKIIPDTYAQLKENNIVNEGMIPKIDNAFAAIEKGVKSVFIVKETFLKKLINENDRTSGTEITK